MQEMWLPDVAMQMYLMLCQNLQHRSWLTVMASNCDVGAMVTSTPSYWKQVQYLAAAAPSVFYVFCNRTLARLKGLASFPYSTVSCGTVLDLGRSAVIIFHAHACSLCSCWSIYICWALGPDLLCAADLRVAIVKLYNTSLLWSGTGRSYWFRFQTKLHKWMNVRMPFNFFRPTDLQHPPLTACKDDLISISVRFEHDGR